MRNHSHKTNRRVTRYRTPSSFKVRVAEASKRRPKPVGRAGAPWWKKSEPER